MDFPCYQINQSKLHRSESIELNRHSYCILHTYNQKLNRIYECSQLIDCTLSIRYAICQMHSIFTCENVKRLNSVHSDLKIFKLVAFSIVLGN